MAPHSPTEITEERAKLARRRRRYDAASVDRLLDRFIADYDELWREREELREKVRGLEEEAERYRTLERRVSDALLHAEAAAAAIREQAEDAAHAAITEGRKRGEEIVAEAMAERGRLEREVERLETVQAEFEASYRALLLAGLELIDSKARERHAPAESGDLSHGTQAVA